MDQYDVIVLVGLVIIVGLISYAVLSGHYVAAILMVVSAIIGWALYD